MTTDAQWRDQALAWAGRGDHRLLIGGDLEPAASGRTYSAVDPADARTVGEAPDADPADVTAAVSAADAAAPAWRRRPATERAELVRRLAVIAEQHVDEIAALDTLDTGVPFPVMRADVRTGIARMRMFADWALRLTGETVPSTPTHLTYTERIPFGVVARIVAYNHPAMFGVSKIAAPLVAGNSVVLKPSEHTPLSMLRLGELWADAVPPGVVSIVTGGSVAAGQALVADPRVRRVAFTGSPMTGRAIQRDAAAAAVKHVSLELGGKNALIVLDDADLELVVEGAVRGMNLAFAGQSCGSTSRVLVPAHLLDELVDRLAAAFAALPIGLPFDAGTRVSPLITAAHRDWVQRHVDDAVAATARVVQGGCPPAAPATGYYFEPTVVVEKDPQSTLAQEEVFGPVVTVLATESDEQAVRIANGVRYGLTGSVYGTDVRRALGVASGLEAGYVWVNDTSTHFAAVPFGGVGESGVGREESFDELLDYTQVRATSVRLG